MPPTRASLIAGIGKFSRAASSGTYVSQDASEFTIRLREKLAPVTIGGQTIDQRWVDYNAEVTINPDGRLTAPSLLLFWNDYANLLPGASIFGSSDVPAVITGSDTAVHTLKASALTGMPSILLHPERGAIGPATFTGIVGSAKDFTSSDALYEITGSGTFTDSTWVPSDPLRQQYVAAWGAVTGFTSFEAQDGWTIEFRLGLNPIYVQGVMRDMKFATLEVLARCIPVGPTSAQLHTALKVDAASAGLPGRSLFAAAAALTIVGADSTTHVTIPKATIYTGEYAFSGARLRVGEVGFYACRNYSSGAQQALYTIA